MSNPRLPDDLDVSLLDGFDLPGLFSYFDDLYFQGKLKAGCWVEWSSRRMTLIKLSEPLLKFRPLLELYEVLLHEMIHAFIVLNNIRDGDHGPKFQEWMGHINTSQVPDGYRPPQGYKITVRHSLFAEVDFWRTHHWKCQRCGNLVKRASNRPPQEADCRGRLGKGSDCRDVKCAFHMHVKHCGGVYDKVAEPPGFAERKKQKQAAGSVPKRRKTAQSTNNGSSISDFFGAAGNASADNQHGATAPEPSMAHHAAASSGQPSPSTCQAVPPGREQLREIMARAAARRLQGSGQSSSTATPQNWCEDAGHLLNPSAPAARPAPPEQDAKSLGKSVLIDLT